MRLSSGLSACLFLTIAVATVHAQEGGIINPGRKIDPDVDPFQSILQMINEVPPRQAMTLTIEGLPRDARRVRLTWERA